MTETLAKSGLFYVELKGVFEGAFTLLLVGHFRLQSDRPPIDAGRTSRDRSGACAMIVLLSG